MAQLNSKMKEVICDRKLKNLYSFYSHTQEEGIGRKRKKDPGEKRHSKFI